jgi:hypothetical protein
MANLIHASLDRHPIELVDRQRGEQFDPVFERKICRAEGSAPVGLGALRGAGSGTAVTWLPGQTGQTSPAV